MNAPNYRDLAFQQLDTAKITGGRFRVGVRLLLNVAENGYLKATQERLCELCGCTAWDSTRRILGDLAAAGVLEYASSGDVASLWFCAWPAQTADRSDHGRSESDHGRSVLSATNLPDLDLRGQIGSPVIQNGSPVIQNGSPMIQNGSLGPTVLVGKVGRYLDHTLPMEYLPTVAPTATAPATAQQRIVALLTDPEIGIMPANAAKVAGWHDELTVWRHLWSWWLEEKSAGALFYRLNPKVVANFRPRKEPPEVFLHSGFYRRHYPASLAAARNLHYAAISTGDDAMDRLLLALPLPDWAEQEHDDYP